MLDRCPNLTQFSGQLYVSLISPSVCYLCFTDICGCPDYTCRPVTAESNCSLMSTGHESVPKIIMNNIIFNAAINTSVISNRNSFRVQFDIKLLPYILFEKCIYISAVEMASPGKPALCQLYRHAFLPYTQGDSDVISIHIYASRFLPPSCG